MSFRLFLFDADDTLFDFQKSQEVAFEIAFRERGIKNSLNLYLKDYKIISQSLWEQFERNEISKDTLRARRYALLFQKFDLKLDPDSFSESYLHHLSENNFLIEGALDLLIELRKRAVEVGIITNGIRSVQHRRIEKSGVGKWIDFTVVSEDCNSAKPHRPIFEYTFTKTKHSKEHALIIGDRLDTDVLGGRNFKIKTCWFNPHRNAKTHDIDPHFEVHSLRDILTLENR